MRINKHINKFRILEWIFTIKSIEILTLESSAKDLNISDFKYALISNSNFYDVTLDLILRFSNDQFFKTIRENNLPSIEDYFLLIRLYINESEKEDKTLSNINYSLELGFSQFAYEQFKNFSIYANGLGRILELYSYLDDKLKELIGLNSKEIVFLFLMISISEKKENYIIDSSNKYIRLILDKNIISNEALIKFFEYFSISIKDYRIYAKKLGINKRTLKCKRIIADSPILNLGDNSFLITSMNLFHYSISNRIFELLNNKLLVSERFKRKF